MMKYYGGELVARNTDCIIVKNPIIPKPTNLWDMLPDEIQKYIEQFKLEPGPHLLEVKIKKGSRSDLGRPTSNPLENKESLMKVFR